MVKEQFFKSREEIVSMFIGLLIVIGVALLVVRLMTQNRGVTDIPGISDTNIVSGNKEKNEGVSTEKSNIYVVKKGDYLTKIAKEKLGKADRYLEIVTLNNIKNPSVIEVGQELKLPEVQLPSAQITELPKEYKVVRGDSLWKISVNNYGDGYQWVKIWNENKSLLRNPGLLEIGMTLVLPKI